MTTYLTVRPVEEGVFVLTIPFVDEDDAAVTPNSATWTLSDQAGAVVNSREDVTISPLASSVEIALTGADLALAGYAGLARVFTLTYTYTSTLGEITTHAEVRFVISPLVNVP